jgi:hypothetical protein
MGDDAPQKHSLCSEFTTFFGQGVNSSSVFLSLWLVAYFAQAQKGQAKRLAKKTKLLI